jgi:hypothetical protein
MHEALEDRRGHDFVAKMPMSRDYPISVSDRSGTGWGTRGTSPPGSSRRMARDLDTKVVLQSPCAEGCPRKLSAQLFETEAPLGARVEAVKFEIDVACFGTSALWMAI